MSGQAAVPGQNPLTPARLPSGHPSGHGGSGQRRHASPVPSEVTYPAGP